MAAVSAISVDFISYLLSRSYLEQGACHIEGFDGDDRWLVRSGAASVMNVHIPHQYQRQSEQQDHTEERANSSCHQCTAEGNGRACSPTLSFLDAPDSGAPLRSH